MAQDLANIIGGVTADDILKMSNDQQMLLVEGKLIKCSQTRYYNDELFGPVKA